MPVSPRDLRDCAKELANDGKTEAMLRASISRAYYAAYHALLPFAEKLPCSDGGDRGATHVGHREMGRRINEWKVSGISSRLAGMGATKTQLCAALNTARRMREYADYRLADPVSANEAAAQLDRVRKILTVATQIDSELAVQGKSGAEDK